MYFCRCEVEIIAKKLYLRPMRIVDEIEIKIKESEAGALFFVTDFANGGNDVFISRLLSEFAEQGLKVPIWILSECCFSKSVKMVRSEKSSKSYTACT